MSIQSKLIRNLKPGDKFYVTDDTDGKNRRKLVTVIAVQETNRGIATGRRTWEVIADYPWWWTTPMTGYSNDRIGVVKD